MLFHKIESLPLCNTEEESKAIGASQETLAATPAGESMNGEISPISFQQRTELCKIDYLTEQLKKREIAKDYENMKKSEEKYKEAIGTFRKNNISPEDIRKYKKTPSTSNS